MKNFYAVVACLAVIAGSIWFYDYRVRSLSPGELPNPVESQVDRITRLGEARKAAAVAQVEADYQQIRRRLKAQAQLEQFWFDLTNAMSSASPR